MRAVVTVFLAFALCACEMSVPQYTGKKPTAADATAEAPFTGVTLRFAGASAVDVSNRIATHCAARGYAVLRRSDAYVLCGRDLKPEDSAIAARYVGDKLSSDPAYRAEFALKAVGGDIEVRARHWNEVTSLIGEKQLIGGIDETDPRSNLTVFLSEIGGA